MYIYIYIYIKQNKAEKNRHRQRDLWIVLKQIKFDLIHYLNEMEIWIWKQAA